MAEKEAKVICFGLADEEYGVDVNCVLGVNPLIEITHVPKAPNFVEGIINIKGKVIPVIDLRKRFGMKEAVATHGRQSLKKEESQKIAKKRIIIVKASGMRFGVIVDSVFGVIGVPIQNIEPPSEILDHASLLKGVGKLPTKLLLLLDMEKIFSGEEKEALAEVHEKKK